MKRSFNPRSVLIAFTTLVMLLLISVKLNAQTALTCGSNMSASISAAAETDVYKFNGAAGEVITIVASQVSNIYFAPRIEVYSPTAAFLQAVSSNAVNPTARITTLALPQAGQYTILITDASGTQTGDYGLSLQCISPGVGTTITYGSTLSGSLAVAGYINTYTFNGASGDVITALAGQTSNIYHAPRIEIYTPAGTLLQAASGSGFSPAARIGAVQLPQTGLYTVLVMDASGVQSGGYGFTLEKVNPTTGPLINYGTTISGSLTTAGDMNGYKFNGAQGDVINITASQTSNIYFAPRIEVYSPNGILLQAVSSDAFNPVAKINLLSLPQTGLYTILILDASGLQPGSYSLNVIAIVQAPTPVTWLSFKAQQQGKDIQLKWATASEQNSKEFLVERSLNGSNFTSIGAILAVGNSAQTNYYQYTDQNASALSTQEIYYRLKQVDLDNKLTYSTVVKIKLEQNATNSLVNAFPNPFTNNITLELNKRAYGQGDKVELYSSDGKLIYRRRLFGSNSTTILLNDLPVLSKGIYLLQGVLNGKLFVHRLMRQD